MTRMKAIRPREFTYVSISAGLLLAVGSLSGRAQGVPAGIPDVPPPITVLTITPGDPGDPGNPGGTPGGPGGPLDEPQTTTTTKSEPKDMKDMKDIKSSVTYHTSPNDYFQVFLTGTGTQGDLGHESDPGHYYFTRAQGNLGFAYHFAENWSVGTILSYAHADSQFGNINASTTVDSYLPSLYVAYRNGGWFSYLSTTDGYDTFTEDRGTATGQAHGAGDGFQYGGKLVSGYLWQSGPWSYGPVVDVHGNQLSASGFNEGGAAANNLHFNRTTTYSIQSQIGGLVRYDTEVCGLHLQPYFSASWQREYGDANQAISGNTAAGTPFSTRSVYLNRDAALLDLGVRAHVCSNVDLYLGWEGVAASDYVTNTAEGGVSVNF